MCVTAVGGASTSYTLHLTADYAGGTLATARDAGPLAGALGLDAWSFTGANVLGAAFYVPLTVAGGWAIGYGLGGYVERLRRVVGNVEHFVLLAAVASAGALIAWRAARWLSRRPKAS